MSDGAESARGELEQLVANPYEGQLTIMAGVEDEASAALEDISASAQSAEGAFAGMSDGALSLSRDVEDVGQAARSVAGDMDELAQSEAAASEAASETASAAAESSSSLSDAANATTLASGAASGGAVSWRMLSGVMRPLAKEAGVTKGAMAEVNTAMRAGAIGSRMLAGGGEAALASLARMGVYGLAAAAVIGGLALQWKTNMFFIRDNTMSVRLQLTHAFKQIVGDLVGAGRAVHKFGEENRLAGAPVRFFESAVLGAGKAIHWLTGLLGDEGRAHNQVTAQIDRAKAAEDRLRAATDSLKTSRDNLTTATRNYEDAEMRVANAATGTERAHLGVERANRQVAKAEQAKSALQASGTATAGELADVELELEEALLSQKEATNQVIAADKEKNRSTQDVITAQQEEEKATDELRAASDEATAAAGEMKSAQDDLAASAQNLEGMITSLRMTGVEEYRTFADQATEQLNRIRDAQNQIDPTLRQSPSLVEKVEAGIGSMMNHYRRWSEYVAAPQNVVPIKPQVQTAAAPVTSQQSSRQDRGVIFSGPITVVANDPYSLGRQLSQRAALSGKSNLTGYMIRPR